MSKPDAFDNVDYRTSGVTAHLFLWTAFHMSGPKGAQSNRFPAFSVWRVIRDLFDFSSGTVS